MSLTVATLAAVGLTACGSDDEPAATVSERQAAAPTEVRIASIPAFGTLPLRVAEVQGFFEKEGLDVTVTPTQDVGAAVAALGKQFEISLGAIPLLVSAAAKGLDVQAISAMQDVDGEHPNSVLVAKEPIENISDLNGKRVGVVSTAGITGESIHYLAKNAGLGPQQIRFKTTPLPTTADQVRAGQLDAAVSGVPFFTGLEDLWVGDEDVVWAAVKQADPDATQTPVGAMLTSKSWAAENPEAVAGYRRAIAEAMRWIEDNGDEARQLLSDWTKIDRRVIDASPFPLLAVKITAQQIQAQMTIMKANGTLPESAPAAADLVVEGAGEEP